MFLSETERQQYQRRRRLPSGETRQRRCRPRAELCFSQCYEPCRRYDNYSRRRCGNRARIIAICWWGVP